MRLFIITGDHPILFKFLHLMILILPRCSLDHWACDGCHPAQWWWQLWVQPNHCPRCSQSTRCKFLKIRFHWSCCFKSPSRVSLCSWCLWATGRWWRTWGRRRSPAIASLKTRLPPGNTSQHPLSNIFLKNCNYLLHKVPYNKSDSLDIYFTITYLFYDWSITKKVLEKIIH